ncbi:MAG: Clp protease N-terminal domain-containing protein [Planctomycetota bacterium]
MFERFTEHARSVMALANQEAQRFGHDCIRSEHILSGLAKEVSGVAAAVLEHFDVDLKPLRAAVETLLEQRPHLEAVEKLPPSAHAREVVTYAIEEARSLGHNYIGTEHLLLGMMRDAEMVSAAVLANLGLEIDAVRDEVRRLAPPSHDTPRG